MLPMYKLKHNKITIYIPTNSLNIVGLNTKAEEEETQLLLSNTYVGVTQVRNIKVSALYIGCSKHTYLDMPDVPTPVCLLTIWNVATPVAAYSTPRASAPLLVSRISIPSNWSTLSGKAPLDVKTLFPREFWQLPLANFISLFRLFWSATLFIQSKIFKKRAIACMPTMHCDVFHLNHSVFE